MIHRHKRVRAAAVVVAAAVCGCSPQPAEEEKVRRDAPVSDWVEVPLSRDPAHLEVQYQLSEALEANRLDEAIRLAVRLVELEPRARQPYGIASDLWQRVQDDARALEFFTRAAADHPDVPYPWHYKGVHEFRLGDYQQCLASFQRALALHPTDAQTHYEIARTLHRTGQFERALDEHRLVYELDSGSPVRTAAFARALRIAGDDDAAEDVIRKGLELAPESVDLLIAQARLRAGQAKNDEAEATLRRAVELDPHSVHARRDLAQLLMRRGADDEGQLHLGRAEWTEAYRQLADELQKLMRSAPDEPEYPLLSAELEMAQNNLASAAALLARSEQLGGPTQRIAAGRVWVFSLAGEHEKVRADLARIASWDDPRADLARAVFAFSERDVEQGGNLLRRAVEQGSHDRAFLLCASNVARRAGNQRLADRLLRQAAAAPIQIRTALTHTRPPAN